MLRLPQLALVPLGCLALLGLPARAPATPLPPLSLDPALSSIAPEVGAPAPLSGTLGIEVGSLPLGLGTTTFDVVDLAATGGGLSVALDPGIANPGLGVVNAAGSFLVPTLFLALDGVTGPLLLAVTDVTGSVTFAAGGLGIAALDTTFQVDAGDPDGVFSVTVHAVVPEPGTLGLLAAGLAATAAVRARRRAPEAP